MTNKEKKEERKEQSGTFLCTVLPILVLIFYIYIEYIRELARNPFGLMPISKRQAPKAH